MADIGLKDLPSDLYITNELARRPQKAADHLQEKRALQELAQRMVSDPEDVLPRFVDLAMQMAGGVSAGLSLYEPDPAPGVFRWRYLRGVLAPFEDATTPRNFSPCGITLDQNGPVLSLHPERFYNWISDAHIVVPEVLLVPLYLGTSEPLGTLWIVSEKEGLFDSGHARMASELGSFVGLALQMLATKKKLETALDQQATIAGEMAHRVMNLFAIAEGMVRMTAKTTETKEEMARTLSGRFHALSTAHGLIRKSFNQGREQDVTDLSALIAAIMKPHDLPGRGIARFTIGGPPTVCGQNALSSIALVVHELATNAAKYGALNTEDGRVDIHWRTDDRDLNFQWIERGGPGIAAPPIAQGFGSKLLHDMVSRQFGGTIVHDWQPEGLKVAISLPLDGLVH